MCQWGTDTIVRVPIPADLSYTGLFRWDYKAIDSCIADLVQALNKDAIYTANCCCGHTKTCGQIILHDGRVLMVAQDQDEAQTISEFVQNLRETKAEGKTFG